MLVGNVKNAHFRGKNQAIVVGHVITGGAQAVAVQGGTHHFAVGEQQGGGAIPGLHHGGVVVEHVAACGGDVGVLAPGLGHQHHDGLGQLNAAEHEEFQGVVQHGAVGALTCDNGHDTVHFLLKNRGAHGFFASVHSVKVTADGIDFAIMQQHAVGVRALPAGVGVGGEAAVHQGDGAFAAGVLQVQVELAQLLHQEHALVDNGAAAEAGYVALLGGLLEFAPD